MTAPDTDTLAGLLTLAMPAMDGLRRIKAEDWSVDMPGDGGWACVGREDNSPRIIVIERGWGKTADARQDAVERLCILSPTLAAETIALRAQAAKDKARIERLEAALKGARALLRSGADLLSVESEALREGITVNGELRADPEDATAVEAIEDIEAWIADVADFVNARAALEDGE